jgi:hypothetical protein
MLYQVQTLSINFARNLNFYEKMDGSCGHISTG